MKTHLIPSVEKRLPSYDALILPFAVHSAQNDGQKIVPLFDIGSLGYNSPIALQYQLICQMKAFQGKEDEIVLQYIDSPYEKRVVFVGLGDLYEEGYVSSDAVRSGFAKAIQLLSKEKDVQKVSVVVPVFSQEAHVGKPLVYSRLIRAMFEGIGFGSYRFQKYITSSLSSALSDVCFISENVETVLEEEMAVSAAMKGIELTRDLINSSAQEATPEAISQLARETLSQIPGISCEVFDLDRIRREKMGLLEAVGNGAENEPRFVIIDWKGADSDRTVFIGKGITYDTGGLNLKPTGSMETMRADMAGAGTLLGLMHTISSLKLPIWATAILPLAENAVDASSMRPGDVYTSRKGTTIEIANTDAEGRLVLADAFDYAVTELKPARIVDIATLTGASEVALGSDISALFSNSDALAYSLEQAAKKSGENVWRLPLHKKYFSLLKSDYADMRNVTGSRYGGAINAALFLEHFVGNIPWAHLDIAGPAYYKDGRGIYGKGATSIPFRTLLEYCYEMAGKQR